MSKRGFFQLLGGFLGIESADSKRKKAFMELSDALVQEVRDFKVPLISVVQKEFELLSLKQDILQKPRRRKSKVLQFNNIYHEPVFVSIEKAVDRYIGDAALKVFSKSGVYTFWIRPDYVSIWNGKEFWGNLMPDGRFVFKNNKVVGQVKTNHNHKRLEVWVSEQLQVAIDLTQRDIKDSTRALSYAYFSTDSAYELSAMLALFILANPDAGFKFTF